MGYNNYYCRFEAPAGSFVSALNQLGFHRISFDHILYLASRLNKPFARCVRTRSTHMFVCVCLLDYCVLFCIYSSWRGFSV